MIKVSVNDNNNNNNVRYGVCVIKYAWMMLSTLSLLQYSTTLPELREVEGDTY